jgi:hypothetical protein
MGSFAEVLRALNAMKDDAVIEDYAVAGAMAVGFWTEPIATYDLDVLAILPHSTGSLLSLEPVYEWARKRGFEAKDEHIVIAGVPTQVLPSPNELADEAIREAAVLDYEGVPVRVVRPEHLIALFSEPHARTQKRRERAAALMERPDLDHARLDAILKRHGLAV